MRQYRGKSKDKDERWIYGWYSYNSKRNIHMITEDNNGTWEVIPETVGQFTGLKDNKRTEEYPEGQEIYEGDIVDVKKETMIGHFYKNKTCNTFRREVFWDKSATRFAHRCPCTFQAIPMNSIVPIEIIGNIHQNPELLEQDNG